MAASMRSLVNEPFPMSARIASSWLSGESSAPHRGIERSIAYFIAVAALGVLCFVIGHSENLKPLIEVYREAIASCDKPAGAETNQCALMQNVIAEDRPEDVLDIGISSGVTTLEMAHALENAGALPRITGNRLCAA